MPNPLLNRISPEALPEPLASAWQKSMDLRGDATFFEVFGNHPEIFKWYVESLYGTIFNGGKVGRPVKELLRLKLSTLHGCRFCNQGNRADALAAGIRSEQVDAIETFEIGPFTDAEKATLRLAEMIALTNPSGELNDGLYKELKRHYDDGQILELGMLAGLLSGMAKFMFAFDLVEKEENCPFPHQREDATQ